MVSYLAPYLIITGVIILLLICVRITTSIRNSKHEDKSKSIFDKLKDFNATDVFLSKTSGSSIGYDFERKKICILHYARATENEISTRVYEYKDILQSELVVDGETISKQSTTGTVGRALLGGVIGRCRSINRRGNWL